MITSSHKIGPHSISGDPEIDWSHAAAHLADLYRTSLLNDNAEDLINLDRDFRSRLLRANSLTELSTEDQALVQELVEPSGDDISYWPGGDNYAVTAGVTNPLGLPGSLWGLVGVDEDESVGLVSALVRPDDEGSLEIMLPDNQGWQPVYDMSIMEDETLVGMLPESISIYQRYARDNTLGVVSSYYLSPLGPFPTAKQMAVLEPEETMPLREGDPRRKSSEVAEVEDEEVEVEEEVETPEAEEPEMEDEEPEDEDDEAVTASVTLTSEDDLPEAIAAAINDPDLRWYVERRVEALGLEASLPWLQN